MIFRSVGGVIAGVLVTAIVYWIAAVVALLSLHGIPLGSAGGPPTTADVSVHLAFAVAASCCGGVVAGRIAGYRPDLHALALGVLLATVVFLGFSKETSNWPAWFPYGMAVACGLGAVVASRLTTRRPFSP